MAARDRLEVVNNCSSSARTYHRNSLRSSLFGNGEPKREAI